MLKQLTKIFDGEVLRLEQVADGDRRIKTVIILNNTPFYLYISNTSNPTRENALFVVTPYTDVVMPLSHSQALFVLEGPAIGVVPANAQATIIYGGDVREAAFRHVGRTVVIPLLKQATAGKTTSGLTSQSGNFGGSDSSAASSTPQPFAIPATARRRTVYGVTPDSGGFKSAAIEGSVDGQKWFPLTDLPKGSQTMIAPFPEEVALPPYLRLTADGGPGAEIYMVVDL